MSEFYFTDDKEFMEKLKAFFSNDTRRKFRRTGRSTALAKILIELSIESGQNVNFLDHMDVHKEVSDNMIQDLIKKVITTSYESFGVHILVRRLDKWTYSFQVTRGFDIYEKLRIKELFIPSPKENFFFE